MKQLQMRKKLHAFFAMCMLSFFVTVIVIYGLYFVKGYAPFGNNSLAAMDARIQYLDFFSYMKDVLSRDNRIVYTFSKTLGGSNIAVFSYYLSSPFNLLLIFFEKKNMVCFFDCAVALKLGAAAFTMSYFLQERFSNRMSKWFVLALSVSYSLMQYSIAQSSNIMWLDGVYMLPLMILGVYKIVKGDKPYLLIISTGLSILFNWYSGCINCLFTVLWFCMEMSLRLPDHIEVRKGYIRKGGAILSKYVVSMLLGVFLSACLFLPTMVMLSTNGRGHIDWTIFENTFNSNIVNVFQNFTVGSVSSNGSVSLYCGSLVVLGSIGFFLSRNKSSVKRIKIGVIMIISLLTFYWQPLYAVFSLFKVVLSYWYRHSYVVIFLFVFIAADYYSEIGKEKKVAREAIRNAVLGSAILLVLSYINPIWELKHVYYTCFFWTGTAVLLILSIKGFPVFNRVKAKRIFSIVLVGFLILELSYNTGLLFDRYHAEIAEGYEQYSLSQQSQIDDIQDQDLGDYRISQTSNFYMDGENLTANYNEALAYGYMSISGYTSDPDQRQSSFLGKLGYRVYNSNFNIVNTSILGADSLLGVKYILSDYSIEGLEKVDSIEEANGKSVYYNSYALPFAFIYDADVYVEDINDEDNPFEYQNYLYSQLLGEKVDLYIAAEFDVSEEGDSIVYTLDIPEGNYATYGNIILNSSTDVTLDVNGDYEIAYAERLSPSVFYIPEGRGATVTLTSENKDILEGQFYLLDLDKLEEVSGKIAAREADTVSVENGSAYFTVNGSVGEDLYISIPYNDGWEIKLNGEVIEPELFENCMISISLENGENVIEMEYQVPYMKAGIFVSCIAVLLVVLSIVLQRKKKVYNLHYR